MSQLPRATAAALLALCVSGACTTSPLRLIPEPLPETLAWAVASTGSAGSGAADGAFLGLKTRENDSGSLDDLSFEPGLRVTRVVEASPAAEAGFEVGDVLLAFGAHETNDESTLRALLLETTPDAQLSLRVRRGDTIFDVPVQLRASGASADTAPAVVARLDPARSAAGWVTGRGGVVLVSSRDDAPFPRAGVPVGSVLLALDGEPLRSDRALIRRLATYPPGATVEVEIDDGEDGTRRERVQLLGEGRRVTRFSLPVLFTYTADAEGHGRRFVILDLWIISLLRYARDGEERRWRVLRFFQFSSGVGELGQ